MIIVYLLDHMIGDGLTIATSYRPAILDAVTVIAYRDATDDAPTPLLDPNIIVAQIEIEQAAFDWILVSNDYGPGAILYDMPNPYPPNGTPDAAEWGQRRSYMSRLGIKQADITAMLGTVGNPYKRQQAADNIINWVRTLPKKIAVPTVKIGAVAVPVSSEWTYKNIITPIVSTVKKLAGKA